MSTKIPDPPRLSLRRIISDKAMNFREGAFLRGVGSVLNIFSPHIAAPDQSAVEDASDDVVSIYQDWKRVGDDMRGAMQGFRT